MNFSNYRTRCIFTIVAIHDWLIILRNFIEAKQYFNIFICNIFFLIDLERELTFTPDKETFEVGDELRCSACGNPTPEVTLAGSGISLASPSNEGSATVTIDEGWEGAWVTIQCSASNTIEGLEEIIVKNITFHVHGMNQINRTIFNNNKIIIITCYLSTPFLIANNSQRCEPGHLYE